METRIVEYQTEGVTQLGFFALPERPADPCPAVLVSHMWAGRDAFNDGVARRFAQLGYAALAVDNFGGGRVGTSPDENRAMMAPLMADRGLLQRRIVAGLQALADQPEVDATRICAVGFCFGGLTVLDLARASVGVRGVVSFHGLLVPSDAPGQLEQIGARLLVLHGWDDPMVPPAQVEGLAAELTTKRADWQIHAFGGTVHGFTNPAANAPERGTVYHPTSAARAWALCDAFIAESLGG